MEEGVQIGYTITFAKSGSIVIYHGQNGQDGHSPVVGAKADTDGVIYWTIDGVWLTDGSGNKIPVHGRDGANGSDGKDGIDGQPGADGQDGITPQLKIENDYWYISYDNGASWSQLGKATGEDGQDGTNGAGGGDSFFQSVTQDEDYVYLTLSTGERIDIPKHHPLSVTFTETEDIRILADKTYSIGYTITGADDKTVIKALAQDGFRAVVKKTDNATGTIEITTPSTILPTEVLVFVTDGKERTIMRSINFVEGVILISTKSYSVGYEGGTIEVPLSTNIDYTVEIPEADRSWLSVAETRAVMRDETLTFTAAANNTLTARYTTVRLIDALGVTGETILITQKAGSTQNLHIATAGTLENVISADQKDTVEELTLTGTLNTFDFDFIRTMTNLKLLDLSGLDNTTIPAGCLTNSTIPTVILPLKLTAIPNRAFYQAGITSIYIPETVETIGDYAFYQCKSLQGDLVIPDATTSIGQYCFQESTFNGLLKLGNGLQTIDYHAFYQCANFTGDLIIPDNVTRLGERAFYHCTGFNGKIVIGNGLRSIPESAFQKCSGLTGTITLGENLEYINSYAFESCERLTGNLIIPDKVKTIGSFAFYGCANLNGYLTIGSAVTSIDGGAFNYIPFSRIYCKPTTPPSGSGSVTSSVVLYVPTGCKAAYAKASGWSYFKTIEEIEF